MAAIGSDQGLFASCGCGKVVSEFGNRLGRRIEEAANLAARVEMLVSRAKDDDPYAPVALTQVDRIVFAPVEDDISTRLGRADLNHQKED